MVVAIVWMMISDPSECSFLLLREWRKRIDIPIYNPIDTIAAVPNRVGGRRRCCPMWIINSVDILAGRSSLSFFWFYYCFCYCYLWPWYLNILFRSLDCVDDGCVLCVSIHQPPITGKVQTCDIVSWKRVPIRSWSVVGSESYAAWRLCVVVGWRCPKYRMSIVLFYYILESVRTIAFNKTLIQTSKHTRSFPFDLHRGTKHSYKVCSFRSLHTTKEFSYMMMTTMRERCTSQKPLRFHHFSHFVILLVVIMLTATINVAVVTLAFQSHTIRTTHPTATERNIDKYYVPSAPSNRRLRLLALSTDEEATTKKEPPKRQSLSDRIASSSMASAAAVATAAGRFQK